MVDMSVLILQALALKLLVKKKVQNNCSFDNSSMYGDLYIELIIITTESEVMCVSSLEFLSILFGKNCYTLYNENRPNLKLK